MDDDYTDEFISELVRNADLFLDNDANECIVLFERENNGLEIDVWVDSVHPQGVFLSEAQCKIIHAYLGNKLGLA